MTHDWYIISLILCGMPVQIWLGWKIGRYGFKACWAACAAISVCRWGYAVGRVHGFRVSAWVWVPVLFSREWWAFFTAPYDSITQSHPHGSWRAIGQWSVHPKRDLPEQP